jgi:hypothetical protein
MSPLHTYQQHTVGYPHGASAEKGDTPGCSYAAHTRSVIQWEILPDTFCLRELRRADRKLVPCVYISNKLRHIHPNHGGMLSEQTRISARITGSQVAQLDNEDPRLKTSIQYQTAQIKQYCLNISQVDRYTVYSTIELGPISPPSRAQRSVVNQSSQRRGGGLRHLLPTVA